MSEVYNAAVISYTMTLLTIGAVAHQNSKLSNVSFNPKVLDFARKTNNILLMLLFLTAFEALACFCAGVVYGRFS
jgi:hypothetical protein